MSGRIDSATYASSISKLSQAAKHSDEIRKHLAEIATGAAFKGSQRSQVFLRHVVESALRGEFEDLRERSLGITLFDKPADYDTAEDAVVRVTASDVRKRLLQHYGKAGVASAIRIELPSGSYLPEFHFTQPANETASQEPAAAVAAASFAPAREGPVAETPAPAPSARPAGFGWRAVALLAVVTQAACLGWWFFAGRQGQTETAPNFISSALSQQPGPVQVVVGDDGLLLIEVLLGRRFTLAEYENLQYLSAPEVVTKKGLGQFWTSLSTRQLTNLGNLQNAARIADKLRSQGRAVSVRHARQVNARDLRSGNFVILGSSHANPWAELYDSSRSSFQFEDAAPGQWAVIRNRVPQAGEPAAYEVQRDTRTGRMVTHAQVSLVENHARNGRVLLIAGQSTSATELAGEFLLRSDSLALVMRRLALSERAPLPDLEMILRVSELNQHGDSVELAACRPIQRRKD
ncbi:MAG: hypothetical protein FJW20_26020 [Acidimicrobiia bacterium]|nr:hypothetical protein [Acidimicrobiia bacterium]